MRRMLITMMFSVVAINQGHFPVSHIQLMSRCAGAGKEQSQTDSQAGQQKYSIPLMSFSVYEWGGGVYEWPGEKAIDSSQFP